MASTGSFPFSVGAVIDSSVLNNCGNSCKFPILAWRPRRFYLDSMSRTSGEDIGKHSLCCRCRRHQSLLVNCLNAMSSGSGETGSGEESEDSLQVTINKSKKVLALQKDLLDQVLFIILHILSP